ncbi:MAG: 16S rRNA (guanine(527)-N(7))-methyltransferase RsmG [Desulfocapsa sp.]|uniref:Ribosomal RNA small subunit methyltransferase G n=1 Tax=Desulfotalea psychrophila TaxID=84980 RepID=A0ABS3AT76_9BACT|nr:16S rRNA (guanine(527)-N(7))-methyltransferase RsmG [Desulfocapsa sp.]MBN4068319.1 16S rRNA (guanine(527)-N(7))-methyltransferase RsmG [Desulfotalea psychrophila]
MGEDFDFAFIAGFCQGCDSMGLARPDAEALNRLYTYFKELKRWSKKINLIAKKATDSEILEKHFLDSLTLLPLLAGENLHLLDIGTGAGFPGLVCKAVKPELKLTLVEPRQKRVAFLSHITRTLQLENVSIMDCRAEDETRLPSDGGYTHITSRAVSEVNVFLEMSSRFMAPGVQVICMKGPKWEEELAVWKQNQGTRQLQLTSRKEYRLPQLKGSRHLLVFEQKR